MKRQKAVQTLEEDLIRCMSLARKASILSQDVLDGFFIYSAPPEDRTGIDCLREGYCRAEVKAEIVGELLTRLTEALDQLLED